MDALTTAEFVRSDTGVPARYGVRGAVNAMTVDVEDYFQVSAFEEQIPRSAWAGFESRVCRNTDRLLELLAQSGTHATFFVLGWVAEHFPDLVRRIQQGGHELASHGYAHQLVYSLSPEEFRADLRRAREAIQAASGHRVVGYRAPSFSITKASMWALDVLIEEGYEFDASIYPVHHDRYGVPDWPRHPHVVTRPGGSLWELPGSTVRVVGTNLAMGGGGYFRLLPYAWTSQGITHLNSRERQPAMFYLHPWEVDPDQPRIQTGILSRVRHYTNLAKTEERLRRLLQDFPFSTITDVLATCEFRGR